ncbi:RNA-binding protein [Tissierella sp. P1]|uniref:RNA-binding S4 domain-containing protein n=1 Tax=Tissierella sp. P1 TaxID=1280483 RepID=UPI000BA052BD|nr:RNA-binding S4 domain-containing protein [Tissierella sp. P1]OZV10470.1 RNA-binding protein [Tissierella sp. P1]
MKEISIETDYIKLDQFLKLAGITQTGGQAKIMISEGSIIVNNEVTLQRGKKIMKNDIVEIKGYGYFVVI